MTNRLPPFSPIDCLRHLAAQTMAFRIEQAATAHDRAADSAWDYRVDIAPLPLAGAEPLRLDIQVKTRLNPQIAWETLGRILGTASDGVRTVACPVISPRVADMCREAGVSYFDASGNAHIASPGFLVHVENQKSRVKTTRVDDGVDPFAPKSSRIARVLLEAPGKHWQVQALAKEAQISIGLASRIKDALLYQRFVEPVDGRFRVMRPRELLEAWAGHYQPPANAVPLYMMGSPTEVEDQIARWCDTHDINYALTQFSGAWRVAPMVRYQRSTIYVSLDPAVTLWDEMLAELSAKRVDSGANVTLWPTADAAVFFGARTINNHRIVSPIQLYLDLKGHAGRGQEAAQEVFEKEIAPAFKRGAQSHV